MADFSDADYFKEALFSIELVQQLASRQVQLNLFQCRYLSSKLAETGSFLETKSATLRAVVDRDDIRRKALLMLNFAVKRAMKLVRNCCCEMESWLEAAVTSAQIKEDIVDILLDLQWWTSILDIAIASVTWISGKQIELELLMSAEQAFESLLRQLQAPSNDLNEAVLKDKKELIMRLRDVEASPQTKRQNLLAAHVGSRLENKTFETMGDADLNVYDDNTLIGVGGFGVVMCVRWLGRRCALKILKTRCREEAASLNAFQHPHIVQFYRYWEAPFGVTPSETPDSTYRGGTPFSTPSGTPLHDTPTDASMNSLKDLQSHLLMELLPCDLEQHMRTSIKGNGIQARVGSKRKQDRSQESPMSEEATIDAMLQISKAMSYLNSKDVVHRDLKPSNVLVSAISKDEVPELNARGYLRVKLGDFGLAKTKAYSSVSAPQTAMVGTTFYGAPEVFNREVFTKRTFFPRQADVWSFGMMFNEVLSGRPPSDSLEPGVKGKGFQGQIQRGWRPALPDNCPDYLKFCIQSCWQLLPEDRPNFADLWRMLRFAQVRSLGIIQENHDIFTFKTRNSVKRLHPLRRPPAPDSLPGNKGIFKTNPFWRINWSLSSRSEPAHGSSQSQGAYSGPSSRSEDKPLGYLVNRVWPPDSTSETMLDVIFFEGNVGRRKYLSCKDTWVQRGKPDVWWPRDWLPKDLTSDIRVLLLEYSISEAGVDGIVDEVERRLVFSHRWNRANTWKHPVVLVGHSLGCAVIEQLVVALHKRVSKGKGCLNDESETKLAKMSRAFLVSLAGCFFYAAPWKGLVPSEELLKHVFGGLSYSKALFTDLCLNSPKLNEVSKEFVKARSEHVRLRALIEGFPTKGRTVVPSVSLEDFAGQVVPLPDSNHEDACKPISKEHPIYAEIVEFIRDVLSSRKDIDKPLSSSVSQTSPSEEFHSESTVKEDSSTQKVLDLLHEFSNCLNKIHEANPHHPDVSNSRKDFDEPLSSSVIQTSPSDELHSRSTIKEYPSFQKVVGLLLNLKKVVSGPGHFHANQCRVLKEQLSLGKEMLIKGSASRGDSSGGPPWPKLALTELLRVLKLGKALIKDCQYNKLCLKAYLRQGERAQAFAEIFTAIAWCKSVMKCYHDTIGQLSFTAMDEFLQVKLGDREHNMLAEAADEDQMELQTRLNSWMIRHPCSAKECGRTLSEDQADNGICLGAQISARVLSSEGDHTTVLWETSQDALKDGAVIGKGSCAKVIQTTWLRDEFAKKEFIRLQTDFEDEVNTLAKLDHPHIVKVFAYGVSPQTCFFLMDIMPSDLWTYMIERRKQQGVCQPFSMSAAIDLMLQISEAMSYLNSKGMVHRDLKPLNILVKSVDDPELRKAGFVTAKLADFGLAKYKHEITSQSSSTPKNFGTSLWRAPEMYKIANERLPLTDKAYPWQADVYSFGIVCSEILTGKMAFHGEHFQMTELYDLLVNPLKPLRPELPKNCPERLASLIRECWQTNPAFRPAFKEVSRTLRYLKAVFMLKASE